ncbi:unnamed protein product, partial [Mesorhabditis belari]|uniref:Uncharacterized protein n=1 Tax=Mesorhabditis belari TaxID=2138241 RepID=A0AAF3EA36_9BILA
MKYQKNQVSDSEDEYDPFGSPILNPNSDPLVSNFFHQSSNQRTYTDLKPVSTRALENGILENALNLMEDVEKRANDQPFIPKIENAFMTRDQFHQSNNQMIEQNDWTNTSSCSSSQASPITRRGKKIVSNQNPSLSPRQSETSPRKPGRPKKYNLDMKEIEVKASQIRKNGKLRTCNNKEAIQIVTKREANKKSVHVCRMKKGEIAKQVLVLLQNLEAQFTNGNCYAAVRELMSFGEKIGYEKTSELFEWLFPKCPGGGRKARRDQSEETSTDDDQPSTSTGRRRR